MASGSIADIGTGFSIDNVLAYIIFKPALFPFSLILWVFFLPFQQICLIRLPEEKKKNSFVQSSCEEVFVDMRQNLLV